MRNWNTNHFSLLSDVERNQVLLWNWKSSKCGRMKNINDAIFNQWNMGLMTMCTIPVEKFKFSWSKYSKMMQEKISPLWSLTWYQQIKRPKLKIKRELCLGMLMKLVILFLLINMLSTHQAICFQIMGEKHHESVSWWYTLSWCGYRSLLELVKLDG